MKTIAVKYCGGCNTRYDRVGLVKRLAEDFVGQCAFAGVDAPDPWLVLIVGGCGSNCASQSDRHGTHGRLVVSSADDYDMLHIQLRDLLKQ